MARLRFDAISHRYTDAWVLRDLHLDVADGEAHALLGPSGAGKSTLLNLLSGLLRPTTGRILLDDDDVTDARPRARRIAQVFQFPVVYDGLSVRGNLEFPLRNDGMEADKARHRAQYIAELMEVDHLLDARSPRLGAYDRQKVAMARALVRPDVAAVLLDEPLTAVEPTAKWRLRRALKQVQRELALTMIYVTHDQLEALTFSDRVSVIEDGRILQTAEPAGLYDDPQHEFVGHFIGSPGMNLVAVTSRDGVTCWPDGAPIRSVALTPGDYRVGFRPEDGHATRALADGIPDDGIPDDASIAEIEITEIRALGLRGGHSYGLVAARIGDTPIQLRQQIDDLDRGPAHLTLPRDRLRFFQHGERVHPHAEAETDHA